MIYNTRALGSGLASLPLALAAGCVGDYAVEDPNFGDSVRYTIALQTADADRNSPPLDGEKAEAAMRNYRQFDKIDKPESVRDISFVGGGN